VEKSNKGVMMIILILLIVLLLAIVGLFAFVFINKDKLFGTSSAEATPPPALSLSASDLSPIDLDSRTTNLKIGDDGKSYIIQITVSVGIDMTQKKTSTDFYALASSRLDVFYDAIISVCNKTTAAEAQSDNGAETMKETMLNEFRDRFKSNLIYNVNFTNFIISG